MLANNEIVILNTHYAERIDNSPSHPLNRSCSRRNASIWPHWRLGLLIAPAFFILSISLPTPLYAQSTPIALPDDSAVQPSAKAVETTPVKNGIDVHAEDVQAAIRITNPAHLRSGGVVNVTIDFTVAPGWHIYGAPLPSGEDLTPTTVSFEGPAAASYSAKMAAPTMMHFDALGETLPVYQGNFDASGQISLVHGLKPGPQLLAGSLSFQECNNALCKMPRKVSFNLPVNITD
ncbi:MAG TPA: protein-disulfide reductase DsbD domain-containing protein [Candidatus Binataceae bacterium]|nr:protein-disulfide reductase DsbD domain-containing protein [Candidatus Binataceae bacterium]